MAASTSSFCGQRTTAFAAAPARRRAAFGGAMGLTMMRKDIHPEWHPEAKVFCNGVEVMTVGGTKQQYNVDIYSGNHPFYQGQSTVMVMDEGQLNKFKKRFAGLEEFAEVGAAASISGAPTEDETAKKFGGKAKAAGKKKRR